MRREPEATFRSPLGRPTLTATGDGRLSPEDRHWLRYLASHPHLIEVRLAEGGEDAPSGPGTTAVGLEGAGHGLTAGSESRPRRPEAAALTDARVGYDHGRPPRGRRGVTARGSIEGHPGG